MACKPGLICKPRAAIKLAAALAVMLLAAAACGSNGDSDADSDGTANGSPNGSGNGSASGTLTITGSSTVEPISNLLAEAFGTQNPNVAIAVAGPGSGDGHRIACAGDAPIWNSSRQIRQTEIECFADAGIEFIELRVGIDGISVITSIENNTVSCLSFIDIYSLVGTESTGFSRWPDANQLNAELGGSGPFTGGTLDIFAPGEESGTFDSFVEIVVDDIFEERVAQGSTPADEYSVRPDYQAAANDNVIIDGIAGNDHSLGWVGFAFADANRSRIKLLEIDGGDGCVAPTAETIVSAQFPISRFLYTYIDAAKADDPAIAPFIDFMLTDEGQQYVVDAGYVNVAPADLEKSRTNWNNRTTGRNF